MFKNIFIVAGSAFLLLSSCSNDAKTSANSATEEPAKEVVTEISQQEKSLRDELSRNPASDTAQANLILYFLESSNFEKAVAEINRIQQKDSGSSRLWDLKASAYFENGDTLNAIKSLEKAVLIKALPEYIMSLGSAYAQTRNPAALEMADALLESNAGAKKEALFIKGLYYNYAGDNVKAMTFFDACIKIDYGFTLAYREKAICLYDLGKYQDAIAFLQKAVAIQVNFDEGYYWMGRCYEKLGQREDAIANYKAALQIDRSYVQAEDALAKLGITVN